MIKLTVSLMALFLLAAVLLAGITYSEAYTAGRNKGIQEGLMDNGTCGRVSDAVQWGTNVTKDMVTSKHYTPAQGNSITAAESGVLGYACLQPVVIGNPYYPSATPSPVALGKPTLPLGHHVPLKKIP